MELTNILEKAKKNLLSAGIIVVALVVALNIYKGQEKEMQALNSQKEVESKKNIVLQNISKLEGNLGSYKNLLAKKDSSLLMNNLSQLAQASGVKINSIRPEQEQITADFVKIPFSLELVSPDYHALGRFISSVESDSNVYEVEDLVINSSDEELKIDVTINNIAAVE
ncbi:MAG: type 4a pilus biogenesis protein PilO [Candidatus Omnitrophica bacterium]|nr:type 4a pilus biogenesis protein PilO [Candidatus Omnitrophota bacterium]